MWNNNEKILIASKYIEIWIFRHFVTPFLDNWQILLQVMHAECDKLLDLKSFSEALIKEQYNTNTKIWQRKQQELITQLTFHFACLRINFFFSASYFDWSNHHRLDPSIQFVSQCYISYSEQLIQTITLVINRVPFCLNCSRYPEEKDIPYSFCSSKMWFVHLPRFPGL